ncbi:MAG: TIGR04084 family radical SAM/SPASM domain-containing protein [Candidatus Bathyarchaeota archaeon]|nr:TIGR04084 family radical SAM/SPASM domain-containing protein [Candidatus Bathyarchaeum sp.]
MSWLFFHLLLTTNCDLQCRYCYGKSCDDMDADFDFNVDYDVPEEINYEIKILDKFIRKDPEPVLIFYGGEPMLCNDKIKQIMDNVRAKQFNIQTNGLHLNKLETQYVNKLTTIFVSIDGTEKLTDFYRGKGVYKKVIKNINHIKNNGFEGEIVARMTLMEQTDIYENIKWLLNNPDYAFSSIHWQLDAGFWKNDFHKRNFKEWTENSYNPQLRRLVDFWLNIMETEGTVLRLYPLLGVMHSLLHEKDSRLRCGSGWSNYSIQTDGHIIPCPAMSGMKDYYIGHIQNAHPLQLKQVYVGQPCTDCEIFRDCGGRCLYANITKRWNNTAYELVCNTVKNHVESLKSALPQVKRLIKEKRVDITDFGHLKYDSCEVIP